MYGLDDRRAWLVRGANVVLHLFRAAMRYNKNGRRLRHTFVFEADALAEVENPYSSFTAFDVLSNLDENANLPIYRKPRDVNKRKQEHWEQRIQGYAEDHYLICLLERLC